MKPSQTSTFYTPVTDSQPIDFRAIINKCIFHWPLFVVALLASLGCAFAYTQWVKPSYEVRASLLIQGEKKTPEDRSALQELDLANTPKVIESEIEVLKSREMMRSVVKDLGLATEYKQKQGLRLHDLYGRAPVKLTLYRVNQLSRDHEINIQLHDTVTFYVKGKNGSITQHMYSNVITDSIGTWKLSPTKFIKQHKGKEIQINVKDTEDVVTNYQKLLGVELMNKVAPAINLHMKDEVAQRGIDLLNRLMVAYNSATTADKNKTTQNTLAFIDSRLASLRGELYSAEQDVEGYRSERGLTDISSQAQVYLENVQVNDRKRNEVEVQLKVIEDIERYLNLTSTSTSATIPSTLGIADEGLSSLVEKLSDLQLEREKLLATTPEGNPLFDPINSQIQTTQKALANKIKNIKSSLVTTRKELKSFNSKFESSIRNVPGQERQLLGKKRQLTIKEDLYTYLLQKREEASLSYASTLADARIIDSAYALPSKWPNKLLIYALAFVAGLVVPASLLQLKASTTNKVTTRSEIESVLDIPIIAELTYEKASAQLVDTRKQNSIQAEQIRGLRSNLSYLRHNTRDGQIILITSSVSGEGKSFISASLANSFAHTGRKILLIDMDMRRPKIADIFGMEKEQPGISNLLINPSLLTEVLMGAYVTPSLDVISCGTETDNPLDLIENGVLSKLIEKLRLEYDAIILDSPPIHLVTDSMALAKVSDVTLYVIRQGITKKSELFFIKDMDSKKRLPHLNIVFNGIQREKYGYGYAYDTSYYKVK